jgi:hypothetical protein
MADLLRCRSVMGLPPRDRRSWAADVEAARRRSAPADRQPSSKEQEEMEIAVDPMEVRIEMPQSLLLPGPAQSTAAAVEWPARGPPLQRLGLVANGLDGIRPTRLKLELTSDLVLDLLSIALVPSLGDVIQAPWEWGLAAVCAGLVTLIWEELCSPPLMQLAMALRPSPPTLQSSTLGPSCLQRSHQWVQRFPGVVLSHLLENSASTTWPAVLLLLTLAPVTRDMISTRFNLQRFLQMLRLAGEATGIRMLLRRCRQWRQPSRRHGRHEDPRMELPRRGQGPWQP